MIFYFSGTGNSQLAAKQIATITGDGLVSINQCMKETASQRFHSDTPLIFVAPTYAWRLPRIVERWILNTDFEGSQIAYFVLTCGGNCGNAAAYAKALCEKKKLHFCGLAPLLMPENYLAMFPTPSEAKCQTILEQAKPNIDALAKQIQRGKPFPKVTMTLKDKLQSGPVNLLFYPLVVHDRGFTVSPACISCQKCAQRCPLGNIKMTDGKPTWQGNCTHCMACIAGCPARAIEYKTASKGQHRHFILEDAPAITHAGER